VIALTLDLSRVALSARPAKNISASFWSMGPISSATTARSFTRLARKNVLPEAKAKSSGTGGTWEGHLCLRSMFLRRRSA
jgi:hypothetical protein